MRKSIRIVMTIVTGIAASFALGAATAELSFAGGEGSLVGNGGRAVVCGTGRRAQWELLDLWEGKNWYRLNIVRSDEPVDAQVEKIRLKLAQIDRGYAAAFAYELADVRSRVTEIAPGIHLAPIHDVTASVQGSRCREVQLAGYFTRFDRELLNIDADYMRRLPNTDQAALWVHETIYKIEREYFGAESSDHTRFLVASLFSDSIQPAPAGGEEAEEEDHPFYGELFRLGLKRHLPGARADYSVPTRLDDTLRPVSIPQSELIRVFETLPTTRLEEIGYQVWQGKLSYFAAEGETDLTTSTRLGVEKPFSGDRQDYNHFRKRQVQLVLDQRARLSVQFLTSQGWNHHLSRTACFDGDLRDPEQSGSAEMKPVKILFGDGCRTRSASFGPNLLVDERSTRDQASRISDDAFGLRTSRYTLLLAHLDHPYVDALRDGDISGWREMIDPMREDLKRLYEIDCKLYDDTYLIQSLLCRVREKSLPHLQTFIVFQKQ